MVSLLHVFLPIHLCSQVGGKLCENQGEALWVTGRASPTVICPLLRKAHFHTFLPFPQCVQVMIGFKVGAGLASPVRFFTFLFVLSSALPSVYP